MKNILKSKEYKIYNEENDLYNWKKFERLKKLKEDIENGTYIKQVKERGKKFILGRDFYKLKNKKQ